MRFTTPRSSGRGSPSPISLLSHRATKTVPQTPHSGLERSDLVQWPFTTDEAASRIVRTWGYRVAARCVGMMMVLAFAQRSFFRQVRGRRRELSGEFQERSCHTRRRPIRRGHISCRQHRTGSPVGPACRCGHQTPWPPRRRRAQCHRRRRWACRRARIKQLLDGGVKGIEVGMAAGN